MSKGLKFSPLLIAVILCVSLLVYLYLPQDAAVQKRNGGVTAVTVHTVVKEPFEVVLEALGTAKANESVLITTQTSDIVQHIDFNDGDLVNGGQLLVKLNDREEQARLAALDVDLQEAKRQLKRITNLAKENAASEQLLDEQQANVNALKAQINVAKTQLSELEVKAPFDGVLGIRQVSIGALVRPGDAITTLDDLHIIKVDFNIAESHLPSVSLNQTIEATSIAYPGQTFKGQVTSVVSRVDPVTRAIQVRANIDNPQNQLRPGMLLQINLQKQTLDTLVLPEAALVPIEEKHFVFVVEESKAVRKEVQIGMRKPGKVQILSGLSEGEIIVVEGTIKLRPGSNVKVLNASHGQG